MINENSINVKTLYLVMIFCLAFSVACRSSASESEQSSKNDKWETYSASPNKKSNFENKGDKYEDNKVTNSATTILTGKSAIKTGGFTANLSSDFQMPTDEVGKKIFKEYGALFVAKGGAVPPNVVVFKNDADVSSFQSSVSKSKKVIGGTNVELQTAAMDALKNAISEAGKNGLSITPRGGAASARRTYPETVTLWKSRVNPGLTHWVGKGKITQAEANQIKNLSPFEQVPEIFKLEAKGIYFAKDLSKSILYSVAPPGTSQHLSMLALDVSEFENQKVRSILAKHGWFQTVVSDLPHFTYLGVPESELSNLGLKKITNSGRPFWIPAI